MTLEEITADRDNLRKELDFCNEEWENDINKYLARIERLELFLKMSDFRVNEYAEKIEKLSAVHAKLLEQAILLEASAMGGIGQGVTVYYPALQGLRAAIATAKGE